MASGQNSSDELLGCGCLVVIAVVAFVIWQGSLFEWLSQHKAPIILGIVGIGAVVLLVLFLNEKARQDQMADYMRKATLLIQQHKITLARKKKTLVRADDYGVIHTDDWEREKGYFLQNVVFPQLGLPGLESTQEVALLEDRFADSPVCWDLDALIETAVNDCDVPAFYSDESSINSGEDYELFCAHLLESGGWITRLTPVTGDQGVDIVAEKDAYVIAVQCKYVSSTVGNQAVQQALAGKHFVGADSAVVVTNSSFTRSAKDLAAASDVLLLHHSQLSDLTIG